MNTHAFTTIAQTIKRRSARVLALAACSSFLLPGLSACSSDVDSAREAATVGEVADVTSSLGRIAAADLPRTTFVHLFEWSWPDVARECEDFLGPKGFAAVQVSPPQEHIDPPGNTDAWWTRYQPVSYQLVSRSGSEAEFRDMRRDHV